MKLSTIKRDPQIAAGSWVKNIPGMDDLALRVRAADSDEAIRARRQALSEIPVAKRAGGLDPADERAIENKVVWSALVLDWRNLTDDEGVAIPYSLGMAQKLAEDPETELFSAAVRFASSVVREQGVVDLEAAEKN